MEVRKVKHVFFDLDHTLWDFEVNSRETLRELIDVYSRREGISIAFDHFFETYSRINSSLWKAYREDRIDAENLRLRRFRDSFEKIGLKNPEWVDEFGDDYMSICPRKPTLMQGTMDTLKRIQEHYPMHLITNGFEQTQNIKLKASGLAPFFGKVITSESAQAKKPNPRIFKYAFKETGARPEDSLYIGDNYEADILGGLNAGMQVIYFNPKGIRNPLQVQEIKEIGELVGLLIG